MYCPECGTKCETKTITSAGACYDCPECGWHWSYIDGGYHLEPNDDCLLCEDMATEESHKTE